MLFWFKIEVGNNAFLGKKHDLLAGLLVQVHEVLFFISAK
jgi:hypothetical protein